MPYRSPSIRCCSSIHIMMLQSTLNTILESVHTLLLFHTHHDVTIYTECHTGVRPYVAALPYTPWCYNLHRMPYWSPSIRCYSSIHTMMLQSTPNAILESVHTLLLFHTHHDVTIYTECHTGVRPYAAALPYTPWCYNLHRIPYWSPSIRCCSSIHAMMLQSTSNAILEPIHTLLLFHTHHDVTIYTECHTGVHPYAAALQYTLWCCNLHRIPYWSPSIRCCSSIHAMMLQSTSNAILEPIHTLLLFHTHHDVTINTECHTGVHPYAAALQYTLWCCNQHRMSYWSPSIRCCSSIHAMMLQSTLNAILESVPTLLLFHAHYDNRPHPKLKEKRKWQEANKNYLWSVNHAVTTEVPSVQYITSFIQQNKISVGREMVSVPL